MEASAGQELELVEQEMQESEIETQHIRDINATLMC